MMKSSRLTSALTVVLATASLANLATDAELDTQGLRMEMMDQMNIAPVL